MARDSPCGLKSLGPKLPEPAPRTQTPSKIPPTQGGSKKGPSTPSPSSTLGDSEIDFALGAIEALETILGTLITRYQHRGSTSHCRLLRGNLSECRIWLENNRRRADTLYFSEVLAALEDVCKGESPSRPRSKPPTQKTAIGFERYPELSKLALKNWHKDARDVLDKLYSNSGTPREKSARLAKQLKLTQRLHDVLSRISTSEALGVVEPKLASNENEDDFSAHLSTLYTVLSRYSTCQDSSTDIIPKISLSGYRRHDASGSIFDMLFPDHPHQAEEKPCSWQNAVIHVGPEVTFNEISPEETTVVGIEYHEFCGTISGRQQEQLFLTVSKRDCKLHQSLRPDFIQSNAWMSTAQDSPGMSLREILASGELRSSQDAYVKLKTILFYLLVKGLWQFYDSELMPSEWTKDTVEFLVEVRDYNGTLTSGVFLNQPLVSAEFRASSQQQNPAEDARGPHRYPKIRELGIMLLEILLGREIESFRTEPKAAIWLPGGQVRPYTDHNIAKWLFKTRVQMNDNILKPLRDVVERCLEDEKIKASVVSARKTDKSGASRMSLLREAIYDLLVMPLESMIRVNWERPYDLIPLLERDAIPSAEPSDAIRDGYRQYKRQLGLEKTPSRDTTPEAFGMDAELQPSDIRLGRRWLDDLDKVQGLLQGDDNPKRVKVVILDTGFSPAHGDLQYDIEPGNYKDFVDGADEKHQDLTGHGTTIARLILHVLDEVDLYVARVFRTEKTVDESFELLEKGIKWAVEKDADILVMAAGTHVKAHDGVRAAINTLPDKVIVIAAAGNRDHAERVIFPARMTRVMCTYATTARNYVLRTLNPNPRSNAFNFGILGVAIQPEGWDTPLSGTSYAAAIAAAFAAGLLGFSRQAVPKGERRLDLEGHEKMNFIFEELARDNTDQGYSCIVPWRLLHILEDGQTEQERRRRIREYLADILLQRM